MTVFSSMAGITVAAVRRYATKMAQAPTTWFSNESFQGVFNIQAQCDMAPNTAPTLSIL